MADDKWCDNCHWLSCVKEKLELQVQFLKEDIEGWVATIESVCPIRDCRCNYMLEEMREAAKQNDPRSYLEISDKKGPDKV